jgi:thiamine kinase-like enzyme
VEHRFDIRERIDFYETLCSGYERQLFEDYSTVRSHMNSLLERLEHLNRPQVLSHIDSVCDNVLFLPDGSLRLIDWEYAGMCDPLIDVSMCAIYSYYNEEEINRLLHIYLHREPKAEERFIYYSYIALGGFLWCLWAVYKSSLGEEFGEYTLIMYRYAKNYYRKIITAPEFLELGMAL